MNGPKRAAREARKHSDDRGVSALVVRGNPHEPELDRLRAFLDELEDRIGAVDEREVVEIDALWTRFLTLEP